MSLGGHWVDIFVVLPISSILPILPLMFPILWISVNLWGVARLQTLLAMPHVEPQVPTDDEHNNEEHLEHQQQQQKASSFQEDLDTPTYDWEKAPLPRDAVFYHWLALWRGNSHLLGRSANVVQVLGSITALSCVDKKGILSWPNPTAEKVFFLRDSATTAAAAKNSGPGGDKPNLTTKSQSSMDSDSSQQKDALGRGGDCGGAVAEVLDLTHDQHSPFRLEFDDHAWAQHLQSLKPLGLAILVNTCCPLTQAHYAQFCNHVTAVAMLDKDLVPVTNRYEIVESRLKSFMHGYVCIRMCCVRAFYFLFFIFVFKIVFYFYFLFMALIYFYFISTMIFLFLFPRLLLLLLFAFFRPIAHLELIAGTSSLKQV